MDGFTSLILTFFSFCLLLSMFLTYVLKAF